MTVVLEHLRVTREDRVLFNFPGVSLMPGAFLLITGSNGIGKSSFLKRIAGIIRGNRDGKVTIDGCSNADSMEYIAYLGHDNGLISDYNVEDYLRYCAFPEKNHAAVSIALRCFELEEFRSVLCADLSAGRKKRVALASLMCVRRPLWLLDEPSVFLDNAGQTLLCRAIHARCHNHGIVIATTNTDPALFMQDHIQPLLLNISDILPCVDDIV